MAKAIYGHTGIDARLAGEVARLRARVRDLEAEVSRLQALAEELRERGPGTWDSAAWDSADWVVPDDLLVPDPR